MNAMRRASSRLASNTAGSSWTTLFVLAGIATLSFVA
jgi:hypothetical protein